MNKEEIKNCSETASPNKKPKKSHAKMISNLIFLTAMTILVLTLIFSLGEVEKIGQTIKQIGNEGNWVWLLVALLLTIAYFILWPITLALFAKSSKCECSFWDSFLIGSTEHFYNGVTPFSVGGQPFQIYSYTKKGVSSDKATGTILANFVTFMITTNIIAFISLFFWKDFTGSLDIVADGQDMSWFKGVAIAGFVINFLVLLFMIALGTSKTIRKGINGLFALICKPKWLGKHLNKFKPVLDNYMNNAQIAFKEILKHKGTFCIAFGIRFITMIIFYLIPFFIMKACGLNIRFNQVHLVIFGTAFAITSVVFVPTPGGTLGVEFAFSVVIAAILGAGGLSEKTAVALMWRMLTYYFLMIVSFIFSAILEGKISLRLKRKEQEEAIAIEKENCKTEAFKTSSTNEEVSVASDEENDSNVNINEKNKGEINNGQ